MTRRLGAITKELISPVQFYRACRNQRVMFNDTPSLRADDVLILRTHGDPWGG